MADIFHAIFLEFYQPPGRLRDLMGADPSQLRRILLACERLARHAHKYSDVARLQVAFSPVLLEQMQDPAVIDAFRKEVDIPTLLASIGESRAIELVGSGYRHSVLALIPDQDRRAQLQRERDVLMRTFGRAPRGYRPPADIFTPALISLLREAGFEYLMLPADQLVDATGGAPDPWRAYRLCADETCLPVVPLDNGFSRAQAEGLEAPWFADAVRDGVALAMPSANDSYLLATGSPGDEGWFLNENDAAGFFGRFFSPCMEFCEVGRYPLQPVFLSAYLRSFPPDMEISLARPQAAAELLEADPALQTIHARLEKLAHSLAKAQSAANSSFWEKARESLLRAEDGALLLGNVTARAQAARFLDEAEAFLASLEAPEDKALSRKGGAAQSAAAKGRRKPKKTSTARKTTRQGQLSTASKATEGAAKRSKSNETKAPAVEQSVKSADKKATRAAPVSPAGEEKKPAVRSRKAKPARAMTAAGGSQSATKAKSVSAKKTPPTSTQGTKPSRKES